MAKAIMGDAARLKYLATLAWLEVQDCENQDSTSEADRQAAVDYYLCRPRGDEVSDRSGVISSDVADMTNAVLSLILPMVSTDAIVEFEPMALEDEAQAQIESDVVNRVILEENAGYVAIQASVKDALLMRNGCMKAVLQTVTDTDTRDITGASEEQRAGLVMQIEEAGKANPVNGQPGFEAEVNGDTLRVARLRQKVFVGAVPIENVGWSRGHTGVLQSVPFFMEMVSVTRSSLVEDGVSTKIVNSLARSDGQSTALRRDAAASGIVNSFTPQAVQLVDVWECYILADLDGDSVAERYLVRIGQDGIGLDYKPADLIPYALGVPFINPHRLAGESLFDHLRVTQDVKTALRRNFLDNTLLIINGRYVYDPSRVTEADILAPKAGGGIRARDVNAVVPLMVPDVTSGILNALQYEDKVRTERGGAALDMLGPSQQLAGETAFGIERQYASREAMVSMMASNLSETLLRGIYLITHEVMRRHVSQPIVVRKAGAYGQTVPSQQWVKRDRVNARTGMAPGARGHLQATLQAQIGMQAQAMAQGMNGVLADAGTLYRAQMAWLQAAGVPNPERFAVDPSSEAAQKVIAGNAKAGQDAQAAAQSAAQAQMQIQQGLVQVEGAKVAQKSAADKATDAFNYYKVEREAALKEFELGVTSTLQAQSQAAAERASLEKETENVRSEGNASGSAVQ